MTGSLILLALAALLLLALEPAHRRRGPLTPRPGEDLHSDTDRARMVEELRQVEQRADGRIRRTARMLASAGSAVPMHRSRRLDGPRSNRLAI
ncbi:hypothetical protein GCM10009841_33270 [Microlunatus panaciterrae]|uniref:Uncharacterized protein n=1 Tax=Microlunatus panaciterrae TaxID=400768 RepID=A0ABS2RG52_9ACTN|nr:hypothetical protein [Microlunatus panaciterrae]MBM7797985.1 hypothetical protein [Microlunatus panaciterrae]